MNHWVDCAALIMLLPIIKAARPHQWVKNLFVAAPLVFSRRLEDPESAIRTLIAVACFSILSSAVYFINDIVDVEKDRAHPSKKNRPIASGALAIGTAKTAAICFSGLALLTAIWLDPAFAAAAGGYFALNLAYSFKLKHVPFVDVLCIATGFVLRVLGGSFALGVAPSVWLLSCTVLLASMLGFGKRAHELRLQRETKRTTRAVLERYDLQTVRWLMIGLATATAAVYALYTQSEHAMSFFNTRRLTLTLPFVIFGILRFTFIVFTRTDSESPTDAMLKDKIFIANLVLYAAAIGLVLYVLPR